MIREAFILNQKEEYHCYCTSRQMGGDGADLHLQPITGGKFYVEL